MKNIIFSLLSLIIATTPLIASADYENIYCGEKAETYTVDAMIALVVTDDQKPKIQLFSQGKDYTKEYTLKITSSGYRATPNKPGPPVIVFDHCRNGSTYAHYEASMVPPTPFKCYCETM